MSLQDWYKKKLQDIGDPSKVVKFTPMHTIQNGGNVNRAFVSFHDTFIKECECFNGKCECKRSRESKQCDKQNICKIVKIPETKLEVLENYYNELGDFHNKVGGFHKESCDKEVVVQEGGAQYHGKRGAINLPVPKNVKTTALYAFKLKKMGFRGGLQTGWKRARQLATRDTVSIQDIKYMRAWFARHVYTSYPTFKSWKDAGRPKDTKWHRRHGIIAWLIWGGDAAFRWINSTRVLNSLNKYYNKDYKPIKAR